MSHGEQDPKSARELPSTAQAPASEGGAARRARTDRRAPVTFLRLLRGSLYARRRHARRSADQDRYYVDWYEPQILFLTLGILVLSCADAVLTLTLLKAGATEVNTFMAVLIDSDMQLFSGVKMALTGAGLVVLVMHNRFRVFRLCRVEHLMRALALLYLVLIGYELSLLQAAAQPVPAVTLVATGIVLVLAGMLRQR